ncbi:MAG: hypothetical protein O2973_13605 [Gemmatimonadetes bacterium]|nr:hypothetical protein [Gemmatimonadota bacterium]
MKNDQIRQFALDLLHADTEHDVIATLKGHGYWDDLAAWRLYGDRDNNYATIGNQQSRPEAALAEKVVNCIDARLLGECLRRNIDPTSAAAPASIRQALSLFFEGRELTSDRGGMMQDWDQAKQLEESQHITVALSGRRGRAGAPCITIADAGEGQTPLRVPETFLSIDRTNKLRIPFVQGKFNMGGTGALKFCGEHKLQLLITRRNQEFVAKTDANDPFSDHWSVTVVRRDRPAQGVGQVRNSVYRYLAPVDSDKRPESGRLLTFEGDSLPAMPNKNQAYEREMSHGSILKLYEYDMKGFGSHALMKDGLLFRLELLLPGIALPVRVHECRNFAGGPGSFANSLVGIIARLQRNLGDNLEPKFPSAVPFVVRGESMMAQIYAFRAGKADTYRDNEGVIFVINGQTHGAFPKTFFQRGAVKMDRLAGSLLVLVDCSQVSVSAREDLFMNSRDRLSGGDLRKAVEKELEDLIKSHAGLRELRERRRAEEIAERLEESKPLEDVLGSILKNSPTLAKLFLVGQRLSRPHRGGQADGTGTGDGSKTGGHVFKGRKHPTFFRFDKHQDGESLDRTAEKGRRCRIKFVTDVESDYFSRLDTKGRYHVDVVDGPVENIQLDHNLILEDGVANWSINLPDAVEPGDTITVQCTVTDDVLLQPFVNIARLKVVAKSEQTKGGGGRRGRTGAGATEGNGEQTEPSGIDFPRMFRVKSDDENWRKYQFTEHTACKIVVDAEGEGDNEKDVYTFYINVDNVFLRTDMKTGQADVRVQEEKFVIGNVCIGLALIHDFKNRTPNTKTNGDGELVSISEVVATTTRAVAPFLVPMIDHLGALTVDEVSQLAQVGDEV